MDRKGNALHSRRLREIAERGVRRLRDELPAPLRRRAEEVVVLFFDFPASELLEEGFEDDLLGLFEGETAGASYSEGANLPPQISLFLQNLWDYAGFDVRIFQEEVERTYLHELGHFLGLNEEDLRQRDLD